MKVGLHYSFQVASRDDVERVMREGMADIQWADAHGFSSVVFAEHHFFDDGWLPRPLMLAAAAASVTKRMRIGSDIVILALHHPVAVAEEVAVLDVLSGGRAILGVGLGWVQSEFDGFGVPFRQRAAIYQRSIEIVRALLAGESVDNDGHYRFKGAKIRPLPVNRAGVPIWMAGIEEAGIRRAARTGDAWIMSPQTTLAKLADEKKVFEEERARAGLPPAREWPLRREAFVAETDAKAWELFAPGLRHEFGKVYRSFQPTYPDHDTVDNLRKWGENRLIVGSPETVAAELCRYERELGSTECLMRIQLPNVSHGAIRGCLDGLADVIRILG
jgi:alkanesulfonate monooxygenase SsuD/methylene tetrahydromethanopterin reductase-like flavin-dependent oxidoreductase (luciferase family)